MCSLLCRLCLSDSVELYNIWSVMYDGVQAITVIQEIFNIQIDESDEMTVMCPTCKVTLGDFYKFFNVVNRSQRTLSAKRGDVVTDATDSKAGVRNIIDSYDNRSKQSSNDDFIYDVTETTTSKSTSATETSVRRIVEEIDVQKVNKTQSIDINPQMDEIEIKLDPTVNSKNLQTIDVSNLPNKMVVQKVSKNFKIINNAGLRKVTRIILAKNIPANILQQQDAVKKIVSNVLAAKKARPITVAPPVKEDSPQRLSTPPRQDDSESEEDEPLIKTKTRLIKDKVKKKKKVPKKKLAAKKPSNLKIVIKKEKDVKPKTSRAASARSKMQLARLLAQIEEEKKVKATKKLSRTEYEPGPADYDPALDENALKNDPLFDVEVFDDEEKRKLTPTEVEHFYKNGKLVAQGVDLENLYRRIFGLECEICEMKFKTLSVLFAHYKEIHKGSGFIRCCKHKFFTRYSINRHLVKHIRPRSVECPICKKVISRKKSLGVHMQVHLPMDQRRYQCGQCKLGFTHMAQLTHHVARRHSDLTKADLFQCDICMKNLGQGQDSTQSVEFTTKPVHDYHRRTVHKEATDLCQECGKTFKTVASLNAHIKRLHTEGGDPRMKCPHCTSICKKSNLKIHIKTVHEHIRKPCPHCNQLIFPKSMRSHIKHKHDSGLLYPCGYCGKRFKCEKYLKFHMVQHTGIPNYVCEYCPKTFASSGNYHTHRKRVHKRELERIAQEKLMNTESVPVYDPEEDKRTNRKKLVVYDSNLLQSIRYKNPTIYNAEQETQQQHMQQQHTQQTQQHIQQQQHTQQSNTLEPVVFPY